MRLIIFGAGSIGQRHLRNALSLGHEVVAVIDPDLTRLEELRRRVRPPECRLAAREDEAFGVPADAALVCSPSACHLRQARASLEQGWHVFVEKPLSHTLEGTDVFVREAESSGLTVLVGCNLRFLPSLQQVKRLLEAGRIGRPLVARAHCGYYLPYWRPHTDYRAGYGARQASGGGIILDSVHEFSYLRWLLGEPREVFCYAGRLSDLEIDTEDTADVLLRFDDGAVGNVHLDYLQRTFRRSCELIGENGLIVWDYVSQRVSVYGKEERQSEVFEESINTDRNHMFVEELRHFARCVERGERPVLDAAGATAVLKVAMAAKASALQGRVVRLDA